MAENLLQQAVDFYKNGDKQQAKTLLIELLKKEPNNVGAWYGLAVCSDEPILKNSYLGRVLKLDPNHQKAKQALERLEKLHSEKEVSFEELSLPDKYDLPTRIEPERSLSKGIVFIPANCPSCGGELRVPNNLEVAKCIYCGKEVIIHNANQINLVIPFDIEKTMDLALSAEKAKNYEEAHKYYSMVIEHDFKNIRAWMGKGYVAGMLTTIDNSRVDEAWECIIMKGLFHGDSKIPINRCIIINKPEDLRIAAEYMTYLSSYLSDVGNSLDNRTRNIVEIKIKYLEDSLNLLGWVAYLKDYCSIDVTTLKRWIFAGIDLWWSMCILYYALLDVKFNKQLVSLSKDRIKFRFNMTSFSSELGLYVDKLK